MNFSGEKHVLTWSGQHAMSGKTFGSSFELARFAINELNASACEEISKLAGVRAAMLRRQSKAVASFERASRADLRQRK